MTHRTLTDHIFSLSAPYDNPHQGNDARVLFVCSAGLLRSATSARLAGARGINARAAGSANYALVPVTANLIEWAHKIIFVNKENYERSMDVFVGTGYDEDLERKSIIWDIPDQYPYMDDRLVKIINDELDKIDFSFPAYLKGNYIGKTEYDV